jgi:hypothetical protein
MAVPNKRRKVRKEENDRTGILWLKKKLSNRILYKSRTTEKKQNNQDSTKLIN